MKALIAAIMLVATPVQACEIERDFILAQLQNGGLDVLDKGVVTQYNEACVWSNIKLASGPYLQLPIANMRWAVTGLDALLAGDFGPMTLKAKMNGLQLIAAPPNDPGLSYLMAQQQRYNLINGTLDVRLDPSVGQLDLVEFHMDFPDESYIDVTGQVFGISGFGNSSVVELIEGLRLAKLYVAIRNNGFLDSFAFSVLAGALNNVDDPEAVVEAAKTKAILTIAGLPDAVFDRETRAALATFVADGPMVRGTLNFALAGETGLVFAQLPAWAQGGDHFSVAALSELLKGTVIRAAYVPWSRSK